MSSHDMILTFRLLKNVVKYIGEERLQKFINFVMKYMSELWLPFKR